MLKCNFNNSSVCLSCALCFCFMIVNFVHLLPSKSVYQRGGNLTIRGVDSTLNALYSEACIQVCKSEVAYLTDLCSGCLAGGYGGSCILSSLGGVWMGIDWSRMWDLSEFTGVFRSGV